MNAFIGGRFRPSYRITYSDVIESIRVCTGSLHQNDEQIYRSWVHEQTTADVDLSPISYLKHFSEFKGVYDSVRNENLLNVNDGDLENIKGRFGVELGQLELKYLVYWHHRMNGGIGMRRAIDEIASIGHASYPELYQEKLVKGKIDLTREYSSVFMVGLYRAVIEPIIRAH